MDSGTDRAVSLATEYKRQRTWRDWSSILEALPPVQGGLVLDLGCGVGDQAAELVARGAHVIGIDGNEELLSEARSLSLPNAEFRQHDLGALPDLSVSAEGMWCSFVAAYFPDLPAALRAWMRHLVPGGWIALTEVEDLFGHEPLSVEARAIFDAYAREAFSAKRYDFHMGHKLRAHLLQCGFTVSRELTVEDQELSFAGPARPDVIEAWRARLDRLKLLQNVAGAGFERLREEFIACLASANHRSTAKVYCCIATKGIA
jgi:ubiquinone/menaquinone biosynthesis C-methylase UbiE